MNSTTETNNDSPGEKFSFDTVKAAEASAIQAGRGAKDKPVNLIGLAFSGGGIRSATFNLGVLQGLAESNLLSRFDYLSTVSGGGYIGSWFSALLHRKAIKQSVESKENNAAAALDEVRKELEPEPGTNWKNETPIGKNPVRWLRRYSAYLTPRYGMLGLDTLAAVAGLFRNLLLNQTILISLLMAMLLIPYFLVSFIHFIATNQYPGVDYLIGIIAAVTILISIIGIRNGLTDKYFGEAFPSVLMALFGSLLTALLFHLDRLHQSNAMSLIAGAGAVIYLIGFTPIKRKDWYLFPWVVVTSALLGGMLFGYGKLLSVIDEDMLGILSLIFAPVILIQILCMAAIVHTGLVGRGFSEVNREWLGRAGGEVLALEIVWIAFTSLALLSPALVDYLDAWVAYSGGIAWALGSITTFWFARSNKSGGTNSKPFLEKGLSIAPYLIMIGLLIVLSNALHNGLLAIQSNTRIIQQDSIESTCDTIQKTVTACKPSPRQFIADTMRENSEISTGTLITSFCVLLLTGAGLAWRVDINLFSMHQFYRNRLARGYLGASNNHRKPNPFTDFDEDDDIPLSELAQQRPVHLLNTTLNLTDISKAELDWQERRGIPFVFTPHYCGYQFSVSDQSGYQYYSPTSEYMKTLAYPKGVLLGTAVAISGAAASPNMGYHSSPPLAFLMTFCNVRLGRWCPNPANGRINTLGPQFGLKCLISELAGSTSDTSQYVNLTDGGHFENLGIYELIRRQCKLIVVADAGADDIQGFKFEDLGNAINKCRVDFGVKIEMFGLEEISPKLSKSRVAWGRITYADESHGALIYLKPVLCGNEPVDVFHYAAVHKDFPHQSTGDQWFEESQFESYRELGLITAQKILKKLGAEKYAAENSCDNFAVKLFESIEGKYFKHIV